MPDKGGFTKNGVKFAFESEDMYHYEAFKGGNITSEELRKEYSRLRQVANKRLARMEGTRYEDSQTYLRNAGKYVTIEQIKNEALAHAKNMPEEVAELYVNSFIAKKTADLYRFLTAKTGSIRGMQRAENELIQSMHEKGLTFVNKGNIRQFGEYMEYMRTLHNNRMYDSERAVDLFQTAIKKGVNPMEIAFDFDYWKDKEEELSKLPRIKNAKMRTAEEYKKLLEKKK